MPRLLFISCHKSIVIQKGLCVCAQISIIGEIVCLKVRAQFRTGVACMIMRLLALEAVHSPALTSATFGENWRLGW